MLYQCKKLLDAGDVQPESCPKVLCQDFLMQDAAPITKLNGPTFFAVDLYQLIELCVYDLLLIVAFLLR